MKRILSLFLIVVLLLSCLASCRGKKDERANEPEDYGFFAKTPLYIGDAPATNVIEIKTEKKTYTGEGDIHVMATVGYGHLPGSVGVSDNVMDQLRAECLIIESPWAADKRPSWETITEYQGAWSNEKYNSTERDNSAGGDFSPIFSDIIELVFPKEVESGYLEIRLFDVLLDGSFSEFASLRVYFENKDGTLTLDP